MKPLNFSKFKKEEYTPGVPGGFSKILRSDKMRNIEDCITACNDNIKCLMWSFGTNKNDGTCYLKDKYSFDGFDKSDSNGYLSGPSNHYANSFLSNGEGGMNGNKNNRRLMQLNGLTFDDGTPMVQFKTQSLKQCADAALYDPTVNGFQFNTKSSMCKLRKGPVENVTYDPFNVSGVVYTERDAAIQKWLSEKWPGVVNEYKNWLNNGWPTVKEGIENWLSNTYPQLKAEFLKWQAGVNSGAIKWEDEYEKYLDWVENKYPQYKAAYVKLRPYIDKIPEKERTAIEQFIVWIVRKYPNFADKIFSDAEKLYYRLREWIVAISNYLQNNRKTEGFSMNNGLLASMNGVNTAANMNGNMNGNISNSTNGVSSGVMSIPDFCNWTDFNNMENGTYGGSIYCNPNSTNIPDLSNNSPFLFPF